MFPLSLSGHLHLWPLTDSCRSARSAWPRSSKKPSETPNTTRPAARRRSPKLQRQRLASSLKIPSSSSRLRHRTKAGPPSTSHPRSATLPLRHAPHPRAHRRTPWRHGSIRHSATSSDYRWPKVGRMMSTATASSTLPASGRSWTRLALHPAYTPLCSTRPCSRQPLSKITNHSNI